MVLDVFNYLWNFPGVGFWDFHVKSIVKSSISSGRLRTRRQHLSPGWMEPHPHTQLEKKWWPQCFFTLQQLANSKLLGDKLMCKYWLETQIDGFPQPKNPSYWTSKKLASKSTSNVPWRISNLQLPVQDGNSPMGAGGRLLFLPTLL